ncbi:hypothetical protein Vadar_014290 [Vaccinium darrowii]|uniref:Uncharacterized protein n=1 Tax=Vaccinium darrowii TaxID=229202 RepID=A0ACB7XRR8_9ERIC|nr:hypothetical protein Vadar_014290 [Vaccinium darrowii]
MENITGNELDCSSKETEVFIIVTNLIKQMQMACIMALLVVNVALERYYSQHESRFTELNPYQEQIDHINRLVRRSDTTYVEQLRMVRNCFMRLCNLVQTVAGCLIRVHNHIRKEMSVGPHEHELDNLELDNLEEQEDDDDYIDTVETTNQWTDWGDTFAQHIFQEWQARKGHGGN